MHLFENLFFCSLANARFEAFVDAFVRAPPVIIELFDSLLLPEEKSFDDLFVSYSWKLG
jgi:hypothetical protein